MRIQIVVPAALAAASMATCALAQVAPDAAPPATPAPAAADAQPPAATPPAPPSAQALAPHVPSGTLILVELTQKVTTKTFNTGDPFPLQLAQPIMYGDRVIVPVGTPGMGEVIDSQAPGLMGTPAKLVLAARYLEIDGKHLPIHALKLGGTGKDETGVAFAITFVPYVGLAGLIVQGGQMEIPAGTHAIAKLGADLPVPEALQAKPADPAPAATPQPISTSAPQGTPQ